MTRVSPSISRLYSAQLRKRFGLGDFSLLHLFGHFREPKADVRAITWLACPLKNGERFMPLLKLGKSAVHQLPVP